jgi:prophage antirepressor-like protein
VNLPIPLRCSPDNGNTLTLTVGTPYRRLQLERIDRMNELVMQQTPTNAEHAILGSLNLRSVILDGEPWFVAVDVCRRLGLFLGVGTKPHLEKLDPDEKQRVTAKALTPTVGTVQARAIMGGAGFQTLISESGVYRLMFRSNKPFARKFQDWVFGVVLPSIRKNGGYIMGQEKVATGELSMHDMALRVIDFHQKLTEQLKADETLNRTVPTVDEGVISEAEFVEKAMVAIQHKIKRLREEHDKSGITSASPACITIEHEPRNEDDKIT